MRRLLPGPYPPLPALERGYGNSPGGSADSEPIPQGEAKRPRYCGVLWLPNGENWQRASLGCGAEPPTAATTLADGRVMIAGNRDLWIRG